MKKEYLIYKLSEEMKEATRIDTELFSKFDVKRGLRNEDGTGVLVGLTRIGNVVGYERVAMPVTTAVGSIVSGYILSLDGVMALKGWQWLFLLEGFPSVLLGVMVFTALQCLYFLL